MPERSDNFKNLTPHHRKEITGVEKEAYKWCSKNNINPTKDIIKAFKAGQKWNRDNFYTLDDIKEIIN